jgi:hypothetical protein
VQHPTKCEADHSGNISYKRVEKFFLVRILLLIIRVIFFMNLKDPWTFFDKIRPGQFVGKNSGYSGNIRSRLKKNYNQNDN